MMINSSNSEHKEVNVLKHQSLISTGIVQPLQSMPFHDEAPILRRLMSGKNLHSEADKHIAIHEISHLQPQDRSYCQPHYHNCNEFNLILSFEKLVFRITLGDETYIVNAPASIFIPRGLSHSANVIEGQGFFITIIDCNTYEAFSD